MALTDDDLRRFRADGFLFPVRAVPSDRVEHYSLRYEEYRKRVGGAVTGPWKFKSHLFLTWMDELIRLPSVLDVVEGLIGPDILCWSSGFFVKPPRSRSHVGWHQDVRYWGFDSPDLVVTAWIAFSDVGPESGPVEYIPGSHVLPVLPHVKTRDEGNTLYYRQKISARLDESAAVTATMRAGEAAVHHSKVVHRSGVNVSAKPRVGLAVRYVSSKVRGPAGESASLVRGDPGSGFELEPRPTSDFDRRSVDLQRQILSRQSLNRPR